MWQVAELGAPAAFALAGVSAARGPVTLRANAIKARAIAVMEWNGMEWNGM